MTQKAKQMNKPDAPENGMNPDTMEGYAVPVSQNHHSGLVQFLSAVLEDCFKIFKENCLHFLSLNTKSLLRMELIWIEFL